ncbi:unnamed protein product [Microthlaspi erraticum]|uniref:Uncharacterized protein n=1 Tax=Microthlaspi erraticum TaxID=1685480 RepID=A0A6D2HQ33_9BRAS|nr:unnamed protein product [Microthlaspi erraticum]
MSRKGVIAKRVKTAPDGSIENQRPTAQSGWPRNECSALGQNCVRPSEVSAKVQPLGRSRITTRETLSPRSAKPQPPRHAAHDQAREPGSKASRPRNSSHVPRPMHPSEPGNSRVRPRNHRPIPSVRPRRPTESSGHDRSDSAQDPTVRPTVPTDRPNAAVDPKPFLKPNPHNSSPKPAPT